MPFHHSISFITGLLIGFEPLSLKDDQFLFHQRSVRSRPNHHIPDSCNKRLFYRLNSQPLGKDCGNNGLFSAGTFPGDCKSARVHGDPKYRLPHPIKVTGFSESNRHAISDMFGLWGLIEVLLSQRRCHCAVWLGISQCARPGLPSAGESSPRDKTVTSDYKLKSVIVASQ